MKPVGFCVLVRPDPPKDALKSNVIAIPDTVLDAQRLETFTGYLVAIGEMAWKGIANGPHYDDKPWAKIGDHVIYAKHGGKLIKDPETNEEFVLLQDKDIIGVF